MKCWLKLRGIRKRCQVVHSKAFIRSFGSCFVGDEPLAVTPPGCATLISLNELQRLRVETQYLVGIENVRCLWNFERARKYFPQLEGLHVTLALRWCWSAAWRQWLAGWSGHLLYFPDYDPAGLRIFAKEVLPYRADARLLIPADFEALLNKRGDRKLYVLQERRVSLNIIPILSASPTV